MAYRDNPTSEDWVPTAREELSIRELCVRQDLSRAALLRQAVRQYEVDYFRRKAGETCTWSGDARRARDFAGPLARPEPEPAPPQAMEYLQLLREDTCQHSTAGVGSCYQEGRSPSAKYGADEACTACAADRVLRNLPLEPTDTELAAGGRTRAQLRGETE